MSIEVINMTWPTQVLEEVTKGNVYAKCPNGQTYEAALYDLIVARKVDLAKVDRAFVKGMNKLVLNAVSHGFGDTNIPGKDLTYRTLLEDYVKCEHVDEEEAHLALAKARKYR